MGKPFGLHLSWHVGLGWLAGQLHLKPKEHWISKDLYIRVYEFKTHRSNERRCSSPPGLFI